MGDDCTDAGGRATQGAVADAESFTIRAPAGIMESEQTYCAALIAEIQGKML